MNYDVVIVGAGPSGLSTAIRLKQLCQQNNTDLRICILEKASEIGGHILSGAVLEPRTLEELFPNWQSLNAPIHVPVTHDQFLYLTEHRSFHLPTPPQMKNHGNYIISLSQLCRWLGEQAEKLGIDIFPGFAAAEVLYDAQGTVKGIITGDMGLDKNGQPTENYQPGIELQAKQTVFAEGCRGSLSQLLIDKFQLRKNSRPQTYGIGIKELWEIDPALHKAGTVIHTIGWPLDHKTYGGSFLYHWEKNKIAVGFVVGLDYQNPYLNPFEELQRFKTHPSMRTLFENGQRIAYGARTLSEGGLQAIPKLTFPGGLLVGDAAGFLNVPKIKGTHTAMKSGMLAAEAIFSNLNSSAEISTYSEKIQHSWIWKELYTVRNIRPSFQLGLWPALIYSAFDTYILHGHTPWTLKMSMTDRESTKPASQYQKIHYPAPDGKITFDKLSSVYLSNTYHRENQPCHLKIKDTAIPIETNLKIYDAPEQRYCPAAVYEIIQTPEQHFRLQINSQNCVHCKAFNIKDPMHNIVWTTPEGGGGPGYKEM
ncbi:MAG: electron transfer flavoprotein-ubiquinone oxidoreductase [Proteobacteria bacterium]|nr:electron transfer flavoprotein-ubiquinone oxidoreductase [Pseudomonadota bacterium]